MWTAVALDFDTYRQFNTYSSTADRGSTSIWHLVNTYWLASRLQTVDYGSSIFKKGGPGILKLLQSFYYPKITKILCLQRCVACEVRVNLKYSMAVHFTLFYCFKSRMWHPKSNCACATVTAKSGKQQTRRLILQCRMAGPFEWRKWWFSTLIRIFQRIWRVRSKRKT